MQSYATYYNADNIYKTMPIDPDFPRKYRIIGRHSHTDGKHYHLVWGPGKENGESSTDTLVQEAYRKRGERYVPLGIHGTTVAVDWDSCITCGKCIEECPMHLFQWYRTEQDIPAFKMINAISAGTGEFRKGEGRADYSDKPDPIREDQCNWCMRCLCVCPTQAIEIYQDNNIYQHKESVSSTPVHPRSLMSELGFLETF